MANKLRDILEHALGSFLGHVLYYTTVGILGALGIASVGSAIAWASGQFDTLLAAAQAVARAVWAGAVYQIPIPVWAAALLFAAVAIAVTFLVRRSKAASSAERSSAAQRRTTPAVVPAEPAPNETPAAVPAPALPDEQPVIGIRAELTAQQQGVMREFGHADGSSLHDADIARGTNLPRLVVQEILQELIRRDFVESHFSPVTGEYYVLSDNGRRLCIERGFVRPPRPRRY